ncbi:MAG: glutamate-5-semialdehyde dehydrogenase [Bacillota bacterium]
MTVLEQSARRAREAAGLVADAGAGGRTRALELMATAVTGAAGTVLAANALDMAAARAAGHPGAFLDRLRLDEGRLQAMVATLRDLAASPDPLAQPGLAWTRPNGLVVERRPVPLGVLAVIFESRPNVAVDAAALAVRSGNAVLLKAGSEASRTVNRLVEVLSTGLARAGLPRQAVQVVPGDRDAALGLARLSGLVDLLVPRGGGPLLRAVRAMATVPLVETGPGNCHVYVDAAADMAMALDIIVDAKTQRPGVCNAAETLLVHRAIAARFLPQATAALSSRGVTLRCCAAALKQMPGAQLATAEDWDAEYLDLVLAVRVVPDMAGALRHIRAHSTGHSEAIVTEDQAAAAAFLSAVDAAAVYHNASTRFTDGGEFGFGGELGIATGRVHARGPLGPEQLVTYKYVVVGSGQTRGERWSSRGR